MRSKVYVVKIKLSIACIPTIKLQTVDEVILPLIFVDKSRLIQGSGHFQIYLLEMSPLKFLNAMDWSLTYS